MIIIKTNTSDVLINEKDIQSITHNKEREIATVVRPDGSVYYQNVETVIYTSDAQPVNYESKGSKVEELEHTIEVCRGGADFYLKMWSNAANLEKSLTTGLLEAVACVLDVKEENRHWGQIEREYEEAKKAYERYCQKREQLLEGHKE